MATFKNKVKYFLDYCLDLSLILYFFFRREINTKEFKIITGSDSTHFNSLVNFLKTLQKFETNTEVKIINLGLANEEINYILENFKYEVTDFNFEKYPNFVKLRDDNQKLGSYAWKPISIYNEFYNSNKNIIWLDAGCLVIKKLDLVKKIILKNGFYSPKSSNNLEKWTHKETLDFFQTPKSNYKKHNISGGIVGFAQESKKINILLNEWYKSSLIEKVIAPVGSSRKNHRQDQAILSVLVHKYKIAFLTPRTHKIFGILKHQDNESFKYLHSNDLK